jgi:putative ABC transport system permease protein
LEDLWQDVRFAVRTLRKAPGFTLVAVLTLALGIGANTAIFSVINAILLRPLPYPQADRLVFMTEWSQQVPEMSFSVANLKDLRDQNTVFESVVGYNGQSFVLSAGAGAKGAASEPERVDGRQVTSGMFATLGKQPILGRAFGPDEEKPGAPGVALLGEGFWERRFGRDPGVVGRSLVLNGESFTVIGVMPKTMHTSWRSVKIFTPLLRLEDRLGGEKNRANHPGIYVLGRMKPGITVERARAEVKAIAARLAERYPSSNARQSMTLEPLQEMLVGDLRPALMLLLGAVAFVLLIACANVANLLLARAADRQREIAVRLALGARRGRVLRQLLTESVLLSLLGGLAGMLVGYLGLKALLASLPANVPRVEEVRVDGVVLAVTAALAVLTGLVFGVVPAWRALSVRLQEPLKEAGRGSVGPGQHRVRNALVVAEVSMALVLLVGAGLMLRSFYRVLHADAGFRSEGLVVASVSLPRTGYSEAAKQVALFERVLAELKVQPGVKEAAATLPLLGGWQSGFSVEGRPEPPPGQRPSADIARVSPGYFSVMGIRVVEGRAFDDRDRADAPPVCIVDESFARTHWPGESPLGKRVKFGGHGDADHNPWMEVVGEVGHVKNYGVDEPSRVELYLPFLQSANGGFTLVVRTDGAGLAVAGMRAALRSADPDVPLDAIQPLDELVAEHSAGRRLAAQLIGVFATLALLLAAVGIYGVMSYAVAQRTQEIGIRMALGAGQDRILQMVLRNGAVLALAGVTIGLAAAFFLARLISSLLFQTSAADPPTFGLVPLLLLGVALLASYLPARRAARVDPMVALRDE